MSTHQRPLIIYHKNCSDGFGAALAAWLGYEDRADYIAAQHGDAPPDVTGRDVLIIDFAWPRPQTESLYAQAKSLQVIDHHDTAARDLDGLPYCHFDQSHSGAVLAWIHFYPDKPVPHMFTLIEDADLRLYKRGEETARFMAHLKDMPKDFILWQELLEQMEEPTRRKTLLEAFGHHHQKRRAAVHAAAQEAAPFTLADGTGGYLVKVTDYHYSAEVAEYLAIRAQSDGIKGALGVVWRDMPDKPGWITGSVRTRDESIDCQIIAISLGGGGGHPKSSGLLIPLPDWLTTLHRIQSDQKITPPPESAEDTA